MIRFVQRLPIFRDWGDHFAEKGGHFTAFGAPKTYRVIDRTI